ncbi:MAG TPA: flagellar hook-associated protein FlgK [Thermoclostridium caenicola]|uniref:flagellar hook-associated protein FlgK n=1 Tax=Thermoclostridium caenicola TaxID=659425 RepID=UPI002C1E1E24|nr:flagellar hook-associated protein FlgK [Thermoclostridium caenicola]HOL85338.1 flagellar hook-associated protein FlgK [Thermoclostridium caenicola]HPO77232.1 flagellar hook-associated protein FlgK [Thermoclostridium caenicola]
MSNSAFLGMEIALRGLYSSQRGMATVSHNVDNTNTPGYSRQVVNQKAARPMLMAGRVGMVGMGSDVVSVDRIRDTYLDEKYWGEIQHFGEWYVKHTILLDLQAIYNEPSDSGFSKIISDFYDALQQLSTDPSSHSIRNAVKEKGIAVAKYFNSVAAHFDHLQEDLNNMVYAKVEEINTLADQIQKLNMQIYNFEVMGYTANDLRDQRTYLVDKLAQLVNCDAYEVETGYTLPNGMPEKRFVVAISGKALVDHGSVVHLKCVTREEKLNFEDIDNLYEVVWEDGNKLKIKSGELKGYLDMRDGNDGLPALNGSGNSPSCMGIPYYQRKMNEFVQVFARAFNEGIIDIDGDGVLNDADGHVDGYTLSGAPAGRFFTMLDDEGKPMSSDQFESEVYKYAEAKGVTTSNFDKLVAGYGILTARNFSISFEIDSDPVENIAASDQAGEIGNNHNLLKLIEMRHNTHMFMEGTGEDFIKTLISTMGVDGQQASIYLGIQEGVVKQIEGRRQSISGVSLNEEMVNLVKYQQVYGAAAKMIQAYSEVLDILINRLGV